MSAMKGKIERETESARNQAPTRRPRRTNVASSSCSMVSLDPDETTATFSALLHLGVCGSGSFRVSTFVHSLLPSAARYPLAGSSTAQPGHHKISPGKPAVNWEKRDQIDIRSPTTVQQFLVHAKQDKIVPVDNATQAKIVPLSGNRFFTCILSQTGCYMYRMALPKRIRELLPPSTVPVVLSYGSRTWEVVYYGDQSFQRFGCGWKKFVVDNNLKEGDGCVFELMDTGNIQFKVQILRGDLPALGAGGGDGRSSGDVIVID
ncbi:B3 domain-containing protein [Musa troglodytarum]|uniref:B3 domain-containing protein n=1 Tax=Musa troglodytarum TaxID=320322 RepID=A0A9E7G4C3_9LILI|nr:B3 domain-containing protein [Musa troglodytarum]